MSTYVYLNMAEGLRKKFDLPDLPYPVRKERAKALVGADSIPLDLLLDELDLFLGQSPEKRPAYAEACALMAYVTGVRLGKEGYPSAAAHYFEIGLMAAPDNLSLRSNYAVALMGMEDFDEALSQLELVMNEQPDADPALWMLAGRLCLKLQDYPRARRLLQEVARFMPPEDAFWDFLAQAEAQT